MDQFNFLNILRGQVVGTFSRDYRCFSVSMMPGHLRTDVENGGKIILPLSALDELTNLHIQYPMLFKLTNRNANRLTHCGVLEFVAQEGYVHLPYWMMNNLLLEEGSILNVENVSLSVATDAKFQAQSVNFLDISNQKAVLENALRSFACLTTGDMIAINYNDKIYELKVLQTKPKEAVSIIECDLNVEFAPPVGYVEPVKEEKNEDENMEIDYSEHVKNRQFQAFSGAGQRLDGKANTSKNNEVTGTNEIKRGIPNYSHKKGRITFIRTQRNTEEKKDDSKVSHILPFSGDGQTIKKRK